MEISNGRPKCTRDGDTHTASLALSAVAWTESSLGFSPQGWGISRGDAGITALRISSGNRAVPGLTLSLTILFFIAAFVANFSPPRPLGAYAHSVSDPDASYIQNLVENSIANAAIHCYIDPRLHRLYPAYLSNRNIINTVTRVRGPSGGDQISLRLFLPSTNSHLFIYSHTHYK